MKTSIEILIIGIIGFLTYLMFDFVLFFYDLNYWWSSSLLFLGYTLFMIGLGMAIAIIMMKNKKGKIGEKNE